MSHTECPLHRKYLPKETKQPVIDTSKYTRHDGDGYCSSGAGASGLVQAMSGGDQIRYDLCGSRIRMAWVYKVYSSSLQSDCGLVRDLYECEAGR